MPSSSDPLDRERSSHVDELAIGSAKGLLRRAVSLRRDLRSPAARRADDGARFELIRERLSRDLPSTVAAYLSHGSEPGTLQLVAWLASQGIRVLLPVLTSPEGRPRQHAAWAPYAGPDALRVGVLDILEPTSPLESGTPLAGADLVVCPALAANAAGDRLGRGGGWYDRVLHQVSPAASLWALLNDDEVLEAIPTQPWDRRVKMVVTQSRIIECRPRPV